MSDRYHSSRSARIKACELAAKMMAGQNWTAGHLMSLVVFFEIYIDHGCDYTEKSMKLLGGRKKGKLRVIAGGELK